MLLIIELHIDRTRRTALHLLRYAAVLVHPSARGVLYLLLALALLAQDVPWLWPIGYIVEILGLVHVVVGARVSSRLAKLSKRLKHNRAVMAAHQNVSGGDGRPIGLFGLRLIAQSASVPLRFALDQTALFNTLDIDRDGGLSEGDLLYWFGSEDEAVPTLALQDLTDESAAGGERTAPMTPISSVSLPAAPVATAADVAQDMTV